MDRPVAYEESVFINCPFDDGYRPLFEAIVFCVHVCGFVPRCALEVDDGSQVRIEKIHQLIGDCRLAVHDISRTQLDGNPPLPRFNMPLELGIFLGAKAFGGEPHRRKAAVILDSQPYRYQRFISDIAGQDIRAHDDRLENVVLHVRNFLATYARPTKAVVGPAHIMKLHRAFRRELPAMCASVRIDRRHLTFRDLAGLIGDFARS